MTRHPVLIVALVAMPGCGLLALWLGQDASFDQQNYHFYAPWALLHGRLLFDVFPAFTGPTFHNPFADIPFYLLAMHAPPMATGFVLGAVHGLVAVPLYVIARAVMPAHVPAKWLPVRRQEHAPLRTHVPAKWLQKGVHARLRGLWFRRREHAPLGEHAPAGTSGGPYVLLLVLAGLAGAMAVAETGTTFGDDLTAALVLASIATTIVMLPQLHRATLRRAAVLALIAGVPAGVAAGLKLTGAIHAGAFALAFLAVRRDFRERAALVVAAGAGVGAGLIIAGGPWFLILWQHTGNPTFPYLNQIFASPLALPVSHRDDSFVPQGIFDTVLFPFLVVLGRLSDAEFPFRDLRVPVLYGLALVVVSARLFGVRPRLSPAARFVLTFAAASYVPWLLTFAIARYLMPIELMAPALIAALLGALVPSGRWHAVTALVLGAIVATTRPADWGRIAWGDELYGVRAPPLAGDSLVIMAGTAPTAFLIPFFPPSIPFIRADGFYTDLENMDHGLYRIGGDRIRRHPGDLHLLYRADEEARARGVAARFGLVLSPQTCRAVGNRFEPANGPAGGILLCRVGRGG